MPGRSDPALRYVQNAMRIVVFLLAGFLAAQPGIDGRRHPIAILKGFRNYVTACAFSPDGRLLATASHDGSIRVWDTQTWKEQRDLGERELVVTCLAFSPDGSRLAAGVVSDIRLWDTATWTQIVVPQPDVEETTC